MQKRPFAMSIAGYDPSGGAGLLADIKTMEQLETTGLGICTSITLQTESQCLSLEWRPLNEIVRAIDVSMKNYNVRAVKIGVIRDVFMLTEILKIIKTNNPEAKIVWDPVLKSTSEFTFFDTETIPLLKNILDEVSLITPNYNEYKILTDNYPFLEMADSCAVLVKGGHREKQIGTDILIENGNKILLQPNEEDSVYYPKHGSGCVLSSAIVSWLARGETMETACRQGKLYIEKFLKSNPSLLGYHSN